MLILRKCGELYKLLFNDIVDPRTMPWFLVARPYQIGTLLGLYLTFVLKWGPKWMKHRPAFNLDKVLIVYNAAQIVACLYIFVNSIYLAWGWKYKWICEPVDYSNTEEAIYIAWVCYLYFLLKVADLLDTVFFVLRKKFNQVTFLHIYHHTGMVLLTWGNSNYLAGGHGTFIGVINSFVHVIMYSYYLLTVIKPSAKQSFWWKKYITQLQILQFFWCVVHMAIIVFKPDCAYPRWTSALFLPQNVFMLILFIDFYIKNYIRKPKDKRQIENNCNGSPKYNADKNNIIDRFHSTSDNLKYKNEFILLKRGKESNFYNALNSTEKGTIIYSQNSYFTDESSNDIYDENCEDTGEKVG
ncbi:hypothetical protein O3G_MSEX010338 [Manduca sexta]|uniref:Elongation of very long chain fatty acids protein n=1 Tax=Manduca sexta TaxID=7130 RepID=A0A921ZJ03_MANSE|nr:hypothetical protein O3G_MSEX010338 [Manduca sexta]